MVFPFVFRYIIIRSIGIAYVGLDGLFKSLLEVLNLSELGFGSAVIYMMYKPIAEGDTAVVNRLLSLLRKVYKWMGLIMLGIGVVLIPVLRFLVKNDTGTDVNIYLLYGMYLFHTVMSYCMYAYRSVLFTAHQEHEVIFKILVGCSIVQYLIQGVVLFLTHNYYIYLAVFSLMIIPENLLYKYISEKRYPELRCEGEPTKQDIAVIKTKIGSLLGHRIGNTVIFSIDSVIISAFIGVTILAKYDNYNLILLAIVTLINVLYTSVLASVGNKISVDSPDSVYELFKKMSFLWIGLIAWATSCLLSIYQPFITIWMGPDFVFPISTVIIISFYFYVWQFRQIGLIFKDAAGLWEKDKLKPYIGMVLNAVLSILFVKMTGSILGVLIPTMVILVCIYFPWEIRILFSLLFKRSSGEYIVLVLRFVVSSVAAVFAAFGINSLIPFTGVLAILVRGIVCVIVTPLVYVILNYNTKQFKDSIGIVKYLIHGFMKKG